MKVEQNISRLNHLLELYKIPLEEFLHIISRDLKNPITSKQVFSNHIKLSFLKRIDKIFDKGLHYYLDPKSPEKSKEASIFFRKKKFNTELNIGSRKIVNKFEEFKISLCAISKLAELNIDRTIPVNSLNQNPQEVANVIRGILFPVFTPNKKDFLKGLISKLAEQNILVFEFVETWNKKEKANIEGFFLTPNVIVIKRLQEAMSREVFTLAHELGHYLLNKEEVEKIDFNVIARGNLTKIERWCNDFAYYFLVGNYDEILKDLKPASPQNDYHFEIIGEVARKTHLSRLALFTRLLLKNKISGNNYNKVKEMLEEQYKARKEKEKKKRELDLGMGKKPGGSTPKPINSPMLISTIQSAFYEGIINEQEVCKRLNIKPDKLEKFIQ